MLAIAVIALVVAFLSLLAASAATFYARASVRTAVESATTAQRAELRDAARRSEELSAYLVVTGEMPGTPRNYPHLLIKAHHEFFDLIITQPDLAQTNRDVTLVNPRAKFEPVRISRLGPGEEYHIVAQFEPGWVVPHPEPPRGTAHMTVHITAETGSDRLDSTYDVTWTSQTRSATIRHANLGGRPSGESPQNRR